MKKLNITKERFEKSKYFQKKYGKLEYVSESGKLFKTNKGNILKFKESISYGLGNDDLEKALDDELSTPREEDFGSPKDWDHVYYVRVYGRDENGRINGTAKYVYRTKEQCKDRLDDLVCDYSSIYEWHGSEEEFIKYYRWEQDNGDDYTYIKNKYDEITWEIQELSKEEQEEYSFEPWFKGSKYWVCKELDNYF